MCLVTASLWANGSDDNATSHTLYNRDTASLIDTIFKNYYQTANQNESGLKALIKALFLLDDNPVSYGEFERAFKDFVDNHSRYYSPEAIRRWSLQEHNITFTVE
jgi:C-terminal processing protease CtpA/Prc